MATLNKDLGAVTAYGFAKDGGYTGTVQQFESDLASIGNSLAGKADLVNGKVPASELPSFVDDVIEGYYDSTTDKFYENELKTVEITPETGKIYIDLGSSPSITYRWSGSTYVIAGDGRGHKIVNASGTEMTQRDDLQFIGASVSDDSTNGRTVVTIDESGHTIVNSSGTAMTQRADLQFIGATVTDDGTNNRTVVTATAASVGAIATSNIDTTGTYTTDDTKVISAKNFANLKTATSAKRYQILYNSGWSQVSVSGTTYYRYTLTLTYATGGVPKIDIAEGSAAIPTTAEKAAWDLIEYCTVDDSTYKTVYLYAKTQPTSNFYVRVWGCGGEM